MRTPYTDTPADAFVIAQTCTAAVMTAVVWHRPMRSLSASAPLLVGIWLAAMATTLTATMEGFFGVSLAAENVAQILAVSVALGTVSCILTLRPMLLLVAVGGQVALWRASHYFTESDWEVANLHLVWLGVLIGLERSMDERPPRFPSPASPSLLRADDWMIGLLAFTLATFVAVAMLERGCDSDDEWSYTWQAAVFAHGRASMPAYPCGDSLRNFWIFYHEGRAFSQYTPGWPLFMTPFALVRMPWLAGPVAHGFLAVAVARLGRRLIAATPEDRRVVNPLRLRAGGIIAGLAATMGATALINGGSRFSHVWVAFLFAASLELIAALLFDTMDPRTRRQRSLIAGLLLAWLLATRPGDGATLGVGIFLAFVYGVVSRRVSLADVIAIAVGFSAMAALNLVILRLQLGTWFTTGYSLSGSYYPWAEPKFSAPRPNQYKSGTPLAISAFTFFPATYAVGLGGLFATRGKAKLVAVALAVSSAALLSLYTLSELGRSDDFGYGNRFHLPLLVALGAGTGALLAPVFASRGHLARRLSPAAAVAGFAMLAGTLRIAALIYPLAHHDVRTYQPIERAIARQRIHGALVLSQGPYTHLQGVRGSGLDVTRNWPIPEPDVIIASGDTPSDVQCLQRYYPARKFYRERPVGNEVVIEPLGAPSGP